MRTLFSSLTKQLWPQNPSLPEYLPDVNPHAQPGKQKPTRVLIIAPQPFFAVRGTPLNVRAMVETLASLGYQVDLLTFSLGERITIPGVRILRSLPLPFVHSVPIGLSWRKVFLDFFLLGKALRLALVNRYDVIHGVEEGGVIAGIASGLSRGKYIVDLDSDIPEQLRQCSSPTAGIFTRSGFIRLVEWIERKCLQRASAVVTVCQSLTDKTKKIAPLVPVFQIEDFPMQATLTPDADAATSSIPDLFQSKRPKIMYTGNAERYQGLELLLQALQVLLASGPADLNLRPQLILIGLMTKLQKESLQELRNALKLDESDIVFVGECAPEQIPSMLTQADVLVSPRSHGDNTPLKIYSYMAAGKPIVATLIAAHTDVLDDSTAFLSAPEPAPFGEALRAALDRSPTARARADSLANNAKTKVQAQFSREHFVDSVESLYRSVIGPPNLLCMMRSLDGSIRSWNTAAEEYYGWTRSQALGSISHNLLKTEFPYCLGEINSQLAKTRVWEGVLVHTTKGGQKIRVSSRWELVDQSAIVLETNFLIPEHPENPNSPSFLCGLLAKASCISEPLTVFGEGILQVCFSTPNYS